MAGQMAGKKIVAGKNVSNSSNSRASIGGWKNCVSFLGREESPSCWPYVTVVLAFAQRAPGDLPSPLATVLPRP